MNYTERAAHHEAGHVVAAAYQGWFVERTTLEKGADERGPFHGRTIMLPRDNADELSLWRENLINTVAGAVAAQIWAKEMPGSVSVDFQFDAESILALAVQITNGDRLAARAVVEGAIGVARRMLQSNWHVVEAVAKELLEKKELDDVAIDVVLQAASKTAPAEADPYADYVLPTRPKPVPPSSQIPSNDEPTQGEE